MEEWARLIITMAIFIVCAIGVLVTYFKLFLEKNKSLEEPEPDTYKSDIVQRSRQEFKNTKFVRDPFTNKKIKVAPQNSVITVYFVYSGKDIKSENLISVTHTEREAYEVADEYIYKKYFNHFEKWCNLRNLEVNHGDSWDAYSEAMFSEENRQDFDLTFSIEKTFYDQEEISSTLRMIFGCRPLGLPFESEVEREYFNIAFPDSNKAKKSSKTKSTKNTNSNKSPKES